MIILALNFIAILVFALILTMSIAKLFLCLTNKKCKIDYCTKKADKAVKDCSYHN